MSFVFYINLLKTHFQSLFVFFVHVGVKWRTAFEFVEVEYF